MEIEDGSSGSLVLFPGALGDAVCVEPAVAWLASRGPVTFQARGAAAGVAKLFPSQPETASLDAVEVARLFSPLVGADGNGDWLRRYERVVSFTGSASAEFTGRLRAAGNARVFPFPSREGPGHAVDEMLAQVSGGRAPGGSAPRLGLPGGGADCPGRHLVIHPGSGGAAKRAPRDLFREVGSRFRRAAAGQVSVLLGPAESGEDDWWAAEVGEVHRPRTVQELARCLVVAQVYVGNDSGPSHVAAALDIRSVVLLRASAPERFAPRGAGVRSVRLDGPEDGEAVWEAVEGPVP
ncbi:MAG: glycosyltransferase family 9 protein [Candidatus Binatia bacterium]|nr:glycosyltransferase family 9 protein [Candidatus Binatia bacterium]